MYFRAFYQLKFALSENNDLLEDIQIPFETAFGKVLFQLEPSDLNNLDEDLFSCTATIHCSPLEKNVETFIAISSGEPLNCNPMEAVDENGEFNKEIECISGVKSLPGFKNIGSHPWIDDSFWMYVLEVKSLLDDSSLRLIDLICWRCGFVGRKPVESSELSSFLWSFDRENWLQLPLVGIFQDPYEFEAQGAAENIEEIEVYLNRNCESPLGIRIFHQAWTLRGGYPQVALITAISAAEVESKRFLTKFDSQRSEEFTFFKIIERLRDPIYIEETAFIFPSKIIDALDQGRLIRNKIIHAGEEKLEPKDLQTILISIRDLLCLFDFLSGHKWSKSFLSQQASVFY